MSTGKPPFHNVPAFLFRVGKHKEHPKIPDELSDKAKSFIKRCFEKDPNLRATAKELLEDPFIAQYEKLKRERSVTENGLSTTDRAGILQVNESFLGDKHFISIVENYLLYLVKQRSMSAVESSTSPMSPGVMNHSMGPPPPSLSTHRFKRHSGLNQPKLIIPQQSISEESLNNSPGAEMQPLRSVESLFGLCTSWTLILFAMARTFFPPKAPS